MITVVDSDTLDPSIVPKAGHRVYLLSEIHLNSTCARHVVSVNSDVLLRYNILSFPFFLLHLEAQL